LRGCNGGSNVASCSEMWFDSLVMGSNESLVYLMSGSCSCFLVGTDKSVVSLGSLLGGFPGSLYATQTRLESFLGSSKVSLQRFSSVAKSELTVFVSSDVSKSESVGACSNSTDVSFKSFVQDVCSPLEGSASVSCFFLNVGLNYVKPRLVSLSECVQVLFDSVSAGKSCKAKVLDQVEVSFMRGKL